MALQIISTGTGPNTGTGDPEFIAWTKANSNFAELYNFVINPPPFSQITVGPNPSVTPIIVHEGTFGTTILPGILVDASAGSMASISLAANGATPGTNSFDIFQNGAGDSTIITRGPNTLFFGTGGVSPRMSILPTGDVTITRDLVVGAPAGSFQGVGTINATGYFLNGVALAAPIIGPPTALVGTAPVVGVLTTVMASDSAPAINQAMSPTWTGVHTWSGAGTYQPINVTTTTGGQLDAVIINNTGGANGDNARWSLAAGGVSIACFIAPPANTAALITGGPIGAQATLRTLGGGGIPLVFGTNNTYRGQISNSGNWQIAAATSGDSLTIATNTTGRGITLTTSGASGASSIAMDNPSGAFIQFGGNGSVFGWLGSAAQLVSGALLDMALVTNTSSNNLILGTAATTRLTIAGNGSSMSYAASNPGAGVDLNNQNTSNNALSITRINCQNDANRQLVMGYSSSTRTTAVLPGGPTTEQAFFYTPASFPISFGAAAQEQFRISPGALSGRGPIAGTGVDMTPDFGTFNMVMTGMTLTSNVKFARLGNLVIMGINGGTGTSTAATWTGTGIPASLVPSNPVNFLVADVVDNNLPTQCLGSIGGGSSVITFSKSFTAASNSWTASGAKGVANTGYATFCYFL
jgi:hypothetical protein